MLNRYKTIKILNELSDSHKKKQTQSGPEKKKLHGTQYAISRLKQCNVEAKQLCFDRHYQLFFPTPKAFQVPCCSSSLRRLPKTPHHMHAHIPLWSTVSLYYPYSSSFRTRVIWFGGFGMDIFQRFAFSWPEMLSSTPAIGQHQVVMFAWLASSSIMFPGFQWF